MFSPIEIRPLKLDELSLIYQIDRSEEVKRSYAHEDGELITKEIGHNILNDTHFWDGHIGNWQEAVEKNALAFAAYKQGEPAGFTIVAMDTEPDATQILALYVSAEYRMSGIAKSLYLEALDATRAAQKKKIYVAATPTESAVAFYLSQGFMVLQGKNNNMMYLEDGDIHMGKDL